MRTATVAVLVAAAVMALGVDGAAARSTIVETAAQPDGGTLVALNQGVTSEQRGTDGELRRLRPDGSWDRNFGRGGVVKLGAGVSVDGLMVSRSGSARVVTNAHRAVTVWKLRPDGRRGRRFGTGGHVRLPTLGEATAAALSPAGRIAVSGWLAHEIEAPRYSDFGTVRITSRGRVDRSFGRHGTSPVPGGRSMFWLAYLPDGALRAIEGPSDDESAEDEPPSFIDRVRASGTYKRLVGNYRLGLGELESFRVDAQGRLLVTGEELDDEETEVPVLRQRVKRLTSDGRLDRSFGTAGDAIVPDEHRFVPLPDGGLLWYRAIEDRTSVEDGRMLLETWSPAGSAIARVTTPVLLRDPRQRFVVHTATLRADGSLLLGGGARAAHKPNAPETPTLLIIGADGASARQITLATR